MTHEKISRNFSSINEINESLEKIRKKNVDKSYSNSSRERNQAKIDSIQGCHHIGKYTSEHFRSFSSFWPVAVVVSLHAMIRCNLTSINPIDAFHFF